VFGRIDINKGWIQDPSGGSCIQKVFTRKRENLCRGVVVVVLLLFVSCCYFCCCSCCCSFTSSFVVVVVVAVVVVLFLLLSCCCCKSVVVDIQMIDNTGRKKYNMLLCISM
jgi:hypothetical protein